MVDLTVVAIPGFFGSMAYEHWWLQRRAEVDGPSPVDYERNDTIASLTMGTGSLLIPLAASRLSRNFELGRGKWAKPLLAVGLAAAAATAVADAVARSSEREAGSVDPIARPGRALRLLMTRRAPSRMPRLRAYRLRPRPGLRS